MYGNTSANKLIKKNPILHSRTKYIEIRHHFWRENVQNGDISFEFVNMKNQLANIHNKPL